MTVYGNNLECLVFSLPVWGEAHIKLFLEQTLPYQLSNNNIPGICSEVLANSYYLVLTTETDRAILEAHSEFQKLREKIQVIFYDIGYLLHKKNKFDVFVKAQKAAVQIAYNLRAIHFFLQPDQIWVDGSFVKAFDKIQSGFDLVLCPGPRVALESFLPALKEECCIGDNSRLTSLALSNLHPQTKSWMISSKHYEKYPSYLLSQVSDQCIIAHCYILHPVALRTNKKILDFNVFDQDYLDNMCQDINKIYVTDGTSDIFHFEISSEDYCGSTTEDTFNIEEFSTYGEWQFIGQHRHHAKKSIIIGNSEDSTNLNNKIREIKSIIDQIDLSWRISNFTLFFKNKHAFIIRLLQKYRYKNPQGSNHFSNDWIKSDVPVNYLLHIWPVAGVLDKMKLILFCFRSKDLYNNIRRKAFYYKAISFITRRPIFHKIFSRIQGLLGR